MPHKLVNKSLHVKFDNPKALYYPCQVVSGSVEFFTKKPIDDARGLRLIVEGRGRSKWIEGSGNNSITFHGEETFIHYVTYLFGSENGEVMDISAGVHTYNFSCQLPKKLPPSMDSDHGHIRYKVSLNLDVKTGSGFQHEEPFTVVRNEDLNQFPELGVPAEAEETYNFCCWFCKSNPLSIKIQLPKLGYGLGEKIPVTVEVDNKSGRNIRESKLSLKRHEVYISKKPREKTFEVREAIAELKTRGIRARESVKFEEILEIPKNLKISTERYSKVFQVKYAIKFIAISGVCAITPTLCYLPITVGTVGIGQKSNIDSAIQSPSDSNPIIKSLKSGPRHSNASIESKQSPENSRRNSKHKGNLK